MIQSGSKPVNMAPTLLRMRTAWSLTGNSNGHANKEGMEWVKQITHTSSVKLKPAYLCSDFYRDM